MEDDEGLGKEQGKEMVQEEDSSSLNGKEHKA